MSITIQWFAIALCLVGLLALVAILSPAKRRFKSLALLGTALFLPLSYLIANDLLSRPKPLQLEVLTQHLDKSVVKSSIMKEGEAIYLWLQMENVDEPRAYHLPWSDELALQLHKAQREAEQSGTEVEMNMAEGDTQDSEAPMFAAKAAIPPPPKEGEEENSAVTQASSD